MEPRDVVLFVDDLDYHGVTCRCGLCNRVGRSYGCALYPTDIITQDGYDTGRAEVIERVYAPSEEAAVHNATLLVRQRGWRAVTSVWR